ATPQDGVLRAAPGEIIYALYFVDEKEPRQARLGARIVADFAFVEQAGGDASSELLPDIALSEGEADLPRPAGTLPRDNSLPVQVATRELIVYTRSEEELRAFLDRSGGELLDSVPKAEEEPYQGHLVEVDISSARSDQLDRLRALVGEEDKLYASNEDALRI